MSKAFVKLGDIVTVITHEWDRYDLHGAVAITVPPKDSYGIFAFDLLCKPSSWKYPYFQLGPEGMTRVSEFLEVLGHV